MPQEPLLQQRPTRSGFLMIDAMMGAVLFTVFLAAIGSSMLFSQRGFISSGDHMRAIYLNGQAIEAMRSLRDRAFPLLEDGQHGAALSNTGVWILSGTGTATTDGYQTVIDISSSGSNTKVITATTWWDHGMGLSGSIALSTELTDWRETTPIGDWSSVSLDGDYVDPGTPLFNKVAAKGDYLLVSSFATAGGDGLYVFDISDTSNPTRQASSFDLGYTGYDLLVVGDLLYIATADPAQEVRVYDVSDPSNLSASDLVNSANVYGDSRVRSLGYFNETIFVGANQDGVEAEIYSYATSSTGTLTYLDALDNEGGFISMSLHEGYVYSANTQDIAELRVVDVYDPQDLVDAPGIGYNLTDIYDGNAVTTFGTAAVIGRLDGSIIEELVLFDIGDSPVPVTPGPWYHEMGADVNDIVAEPGGRYFFVANENSGEELVIIDPVLMSNGSFPEVATYDSSHGFGNGVLYDMLKDRLYLVTNNALEILQPG